MGVYYCNLCDKTIQLKNKKKHLSTKPLLVLSESIINKYCAKTPELIEIEKVSQKHVINYNKRFEFYQTKIYINGNYSLLILFFMLNLKECMITVYVVG